MADSELDRLLAQYAQPPPQTLTGGVPPLPSISLTQQEPPLAQHNLVHRGLSSFGQPALNATEGALRGEVSPRDLAWTYLTEGPLGPFGMARGPTRIPDPIRAYHGSPHTFDEFRMDRIGTGEGAQAYGHGLYFAESEPVARAYRDNLGGVDFAISGQPVRAGSPYWNVSQELVNVHRGDATAMRAAYPDNPRVHQLLDEMEAHGINYAPRGRMYEVNLHARPEQFLDWDRPVIEQSNNVRFAINELADRVAATEGYDRFDNLAIAALRGEHPRSRGYFPTGEDVLRSADSLRDPSEFLAEAGIPGIRYLDQGSRGAGEGTRNFVVFNPEIIEILRRYGMAGPVAGGVLGSQIGGTDGQ